jgi:replicative DNA helicase
VSERKPVRSAAPLDTLIERGLPANPEAEKAVLGAILLSADAPGPEGQSRNMAYDRVATIITSDDFSVDAHRRIFLAMAKLREGSPARPVDATTVVNELLASKELEAIGGLTYLGSLTDGLPRGVNVGAYAAIVKDMAILRRTIHTAHMIVQAGLDGGTSPEGDRVPVTDFVGISQASMLDIDTGAGVRGLVAAADLVAPTYKEIETYRAGEINGLQTGFNRLDRLMRGLQKGELTILAGRPSMGKSAAAIGMALNAALKENTVAVFSIEMTALVCMLRLACAEGRVDLQKLREGYTSKDDLRNITIAMESITKAPLYIDDSSSLHMHDLRAKCRRLQSERGLSLVVVDHLGIMRTPKLENRTAEISFLSWGLKSLAKDLNVPVVALSQLSRATEKREGNVPGLGDLRDGGTLEQDADNVVFIYREEYYLRMRGVEVPEDQKGRADFILAKNRNGPVGKVPMAFLDKYAAFGDLAEGF